MYVVWLVYIVAKYTVAILCNVVFNEVLGRSAFIVMHRWNSFFRLGCVVLFYVALVVIAIVLHDYYIIYYDTYAWFISEDYTTVRPIRFISDTISLYYYDLERSHKDETS